MSKSKNNLSPRPPKWAGKLLEWFCPDELLEEVQGDLQERYYLRVQKLGEEKAYRLYIREVLAYMRPSLIRTNFTHIQLIPFAMFINYLKIAVRNLLRHKVFSFLNIMGLTLGLTATILILLWVNDEVSYDRFHQDRHRIYSIYSVADWGTNRNTPGPLAEAISQEIPEVAYACSMLGGGLSELFIVDGKYTKENGGQYISTDFFNLFNFPLLEGDPSTALARPNSIVISEKLARKYFNSTKVLGQAIQTEGLGTFKISGVMKQIPVNSSIQFEYAIPLEVFTRHQAWLKEWGTTSPLTFVKLKEGASAAAVGEKIKNMPESKKPGTSIQLFLQPFSEQYLYSNFKDGHVDGGRIEYVLLFCIIGLFILTIACINFMNLSTARSAKRAKEVGVRKVVGATRYTLIIQHLGEAIVMTCIAVVFSVVLVYLFLPTLNSFTNKNIRFDLLNPVVIAALLLLIFITGIVSGSYPAFFLSAQKPVTVLKDSRLKFNLFTILLRKGLVVFQFTLSIIFIIATLVVSHQMDYIQNKNLGLDRENLIMVPMEGDMSKNYEVFKTELLRSTAIQAVSQQAFSPIESGLSGEITWPGKSPDDHTSVQVMAVGYDYLKTIKADLVQGRDFSKAFSEDSRGYVINESAARLFGKENPVGEQIEFWNGPGKIIGVVKDYHSRSLHEPIGPQILMFMPGSANQVVIRTEPGRTTQALGEMEKAAKKINPKFPFEYKFLDEEFEKQYRSEQVVSQLSTYFALLTIFICCLGLFGLAAFTAEQRTKEISIRKVLGASVMGIMAMLSRDFIKLVLLAIVIATPLGLFVMNKWLENFAYQVDLSPWIFVMAGLAALLVAILSISVQALKAAFSNPVKSLRNE